MGEDLIFRPYNLGDEEEIIQLLQSAFNGWPRFNLNCSPLEHWQWKYRDNPQKKNLVLLIENRERIVGCCHGIPIGLKIGGEIISSFHGTDLAIHPDFQGKGLGAKAKDTRDELAQEFGIKIHLSVDVNPITIKGVIRRGFKKFPQVVTLFIRVKDANLFFERNISNDSFLNRVGFHLLSLGNRIKNTFFQRKTEFSKFDEFNVEEIREFDDTINEFWNGIKDHYDFIIERRKEYLNWRYCDPRGGEYIIKVAKADDRILGYIVLRTKHSFETKQNSSMGYIVDLLTQPDRLDVAYRLIADGLDYFDKNLVNLIQSFMIKDHPYEKLFGRHGFINSRIQVITYYDNMDNKIKIDDRFTFPERLHFQFGDKDWI